MKGGAISACKLLRARSARMRQLVAVSPFGLLFLLVLWSGGLQLSNGCVNPCLGGACCCFASQRLIQCSTGGLVLFPPAAVHRVSTFYKNVQLVHSCPRLDMERLLKLYPAVKTVAFSDKCCPNHRSQSSVRGVLIINYCHSKSLIVYGKSQVLRNAF